MSYRDCDSLIASIPDISGITQNVINTLTGPGVQQTLQLTLIKDVAGEDTIPVIGTLFPTLSAGSSFLFTLQADGTVITSSQLRITFPSTTPGPPPMIGNRTSTFIMPMSDTTIWDKQISAYPSFVPVNQPSSYGVAGFANGYLYAYGVPLIAIQGNIGVEPVAPVHEEWFMSFRQPPISPPPVAPPTLQMRIHIFWPTVDSPGVTYFAGPSGVYRPASILQPFLPQTIPS